jgi:hypothetical protein
MCSSAISGLNLKWISDRQASSRWRRALVLPVDYLRSGKHQPPAWRAVPDGRLAFQAGILRRPLLALNVSAGTARFRQLSEAMRKTYARRELFSP